MNPMAQPLLFWLVGSRLSGFILFCPGFGSDEMPVPRTFRALLIGWLTLSMLPSVGLPSGAFLGLPDLVVAVGCEFLLGLGAALALRLIFSAVRIGGTLIDSELSFLAAEQFNPMISIQGGLFNRFFGLAALYYFWTLDYASLLLLGLHKSFQMVPLGALQIGLENYDLLVRLGANAFASGLIIAAPIIAMMFFLNVSIAFLAKLVQGINIFYESFTMRIIVGSTGAIFFLPLILMTVRNEMAKMIPAFSTYFQNAAR